MIAPPIPGARLSSFRSPDAEAWLRSWTHDVASRCEPPLESRSVPTYLGDTHVLQSGPVPGGGDIVLLPGWGTSGAFWALGGDLSPLARLGRLTLVDVPGQPGLGTGWAPPHRPDGYAAWLRELLDALGIERAALMGFSFGGLIAIRGACALGPRVHRLVLVAPAGLVRLRTHLAVIAASLAHRFRPTRRSAARFVAACLHDPAQSVDRRVREQVVEALFRFATGFRNRSRPPPRLSDAELSAVGCPTLLVSGACDRVFSPAGTERRARRLMPALARVESLPEHGHGLEVSRRTLEVAASFLG